MAHDLREPTETTRAVWAIPVVVSLAAIGFGLWHTTKPPAPDDDFAPPPAEPTAAAAPPPLREPRCVEVSPEPFIVGDAPRAAPPPSPSGDAPAPAIAPPDNVVDPLAPFAVEIGRGAAFDGGFAAGARRDAEGGAVAMVATVGADGRGGRLVRLGRSRGDLDPPVVTGAGASVLAVLLEPNAGGRSIKVAKVTGADVTWGPEFSEGRNESLAVDVAASGARAVVAWDDLSPGIGEARRSNVILATVDVATMRPLAPAHPASVSGVDASSPRVIARPGGYWLAYLVHGEEDPKKKPKHKPDDDIDDGEIITTSWIEVVPLDEGGATSGAARAVTPKGGHVLSFDVTLGENGDAIVAFRDDDTPTGSGGGRVSATLVRLGGGGEPHVLLEQAGVAGAPSLLPGWIPLASVNGATRLAAMSPAGELIDAPVAEQWLGSGEPVAAARDTILWARPMGKAMRLSVLRCRAEPSVDAGAEGSAADGGR